MEENNSIQLTEQQIEEQLKVLRSKRLFECQHEIQSILEKYNCEIVSNIEVSINGEFVKPIIIAK